MPPIRSILAAIAVACALLFVAQATHVRGQAGAVTWTKPVKLSTDTGETMNPSVAADRSGGVHVFWAQGEFNASYADTIFYTQWNGQAWSTPRDLFAALDGESYNFPFAAVDNADRLHVVWASSSGLYYSQAPLADTLSVKAWSEARLLVSASVVSQSRLVIDRAGNLYVVYTQRVPGTNVMVLSSMDGGQSWTEPAPVSALVPGDPQIPDTVRLQLDSADRLHVVWSENYPPDFISRHVFHARSDDQGETWTAPVDLADQAVNTDWDAAIDLAIDSADRLHVIWTCGASPGRCYRSSNDGGDSWSGTQRLFEGLIGLAGWDTLVADPYGEVFWLGTLRYPQAFYFSSFANDSWIDPPQALIGLQDSEGLAQAHFPHSAVGRGNQLHLVLIETDRGPVYYLNGTTTQPALPIEPTPTPAATRTPTPAPITPTPAATPTRQLNLPTGIQNTDAGVRPVLFALVPVVIVIGVVVAARRMRH